VRLISNLDFEAYRKLEGQNKSLLVEMTRSPAHYDHARKNPKAPTTAMDFGQLLHTLVLEPAKMATSYVVVPQETRRGTKAWDGYELTAGTRKLIKQGELDLASRMAEAILSHPKASLILGQCAQRELSAQWTDVLTGQVCKGRFDLFHESGVIADIKSTEDARPDAFMRSIVQYKYHWQAAMYCDGAQAITGLPFTFCFIAVEKEAPFGVGVYTIDSDFLERGRSEYKAALAKVAECEAKNNWPCYGDEILEIAAPAWMTKGENI
jgi:hypothetical protein